MQEEIELLRLEIVGTEYKLNFNWVAIRFEEISNHFGIILENIQVVEGNTSEISDVEMRTFVHRVKKEDETVEVLETNIKNNQTQNEGKMFYNHFYSQ